jgi:AI-2 transport protein TqsA
LERVVQHRLRDAGIEPRTNLLAAIAPTERLVEYAGLAARGATKVLGTSVLVMLYVVFMLAAALDAPRVWQQYRGTLASHTREELSTAVRQVQRYLALKTLISLVTGALVGSGAWALGVDFALFWGFLAFVLNFIPNIGSIVAAIPAISTALLQLGAAPALALTGIYLAVNMLIGNLADPIIIGRELRLAPLVVLVSLVVWGWVFGVIGMFLAVPLTLTVRILLQDSPRYHRFAQLLGPPPSPT